MSRTLHGRPEATTRRRPVVAWRVTHRDLLGQRHRRVLRCRSFSHAQDLAEALWGPAQYLAVIALGTGREAWTC